MKLKYLLRGIGIGAILATAVMYFAYGKSGKTLSDDEIRQKARELGMLTVSEFQEKELNSLKDKLPETSDTKINETESKNEDKGSDVSASKKNTPSEEGGETGKSADEADKTGKTAIAEGDKAGASETGKTETKLAKAGSAEGEKAGADKTKTTSAGNGSAKDGNAKAGNTEKAETVSRLTEKPKKVEAKAANGKIEFSIAAGMSSEKVAASLKALGIIDDSTEFNKFLVNNGYAAGIKVGTFELKAGQSYAEIAAELTK